MSPPGGVTTDHVAAFVTKGDNSSDVIQTTQNKITYSFLFLNSFIFQNKKSEQGGCSKVELVEIISKSIYKILLIKKNHASEKTT